LTTQIQSSPSVDEDVEAPEICGDEAVTTPRYAATETTPEEKSANVSPLSTLTSPEQIEHKFELTNIQENLTPTALNGNKENDRNISTSQTQEQVRNDEGREPEDSIPQNLRSDIKNKSSVLGSIRSTTAQVAEVEEKSESQKRAEREEVLVKEGDAEDGKQDQTPVSIAPGCSAQFTSSTCSSLILTVVGNNKDTT
ncbi:unnamed protein product, partial [Allacma fusca]